MINIRHVRVLLLIASVGAACFALADEDDSDDSHAREKLSRRTVAAVFEATYKAECASCHMLYPPGLLPARSWTQMMDGLKDHFGENASVDKATKDHLTKFLTTNAADHSPFRRSQKIAQSISLKDIPLRFTETEYFKRQHDEIRAKVWTRKAVGSPANCAACHPKAEAGDFSEDAVRIPR